MEMTLACVRQPIGDTMKLLTVATLLGLWALICTLIVSDNDLRPFRRGRGAVAAQAPASFAS